MKLKGFSDYSDEQKALNEFLTVLENTEINESEIENINEFQFLRDFKAKAKTWVKGKQKLIFNKVADFLDKHPEALGALFSKLSDRSQEIMRKSLEKAKQWK